MIVFRQPVDGLLSCPLFRVFLIAKGEVHSSELLGGLCNLDSISEPDNT
jgi:hypothetical protein